MSKPVPVSDDDFDEIVLKSGRPVLVELWAPWCRPCVLVAPIVDELSEEYDGRIDFVKIDIDQNPKTPARYGVMSIPTLLVFKDGEPISHIVGLRPKAELKENLEAALT